MCVRDVNKANSVKAKAMHIKTNVKARERETLKPSYFET